MFPKWEEFVTDMIEVCLEGEGGKYQACHIVIEGTRALLAQYFQHVPVRTRQGIERVDLPFTTNLYFHISLPQIPI